MNFGFDFDKLIVIGIIAVIIVGPERLPGLAESLAKFVRRAGEYLKGAKERVAEEMGPEFNDTDWRKLDPRQYDPRRIIRDALLEPASVAPIPVATRTATGAPTAPSLTERSSEPRLLAGDLPPYDSEAT